MGVLRLEKYDTFFPMPEKILGKVLEILFGKKKKMKKIGSICSEHQVEKEKWGVIHHGKSFISQNMLLIVATRMKRLTHFRA